MIFILNLFSSFAQNRIELILNDCSQENGFTMFPLVIANPNVLTEHKTKYTGKYFDNSKMIILNYSDTLRIEYRNIYGQIIDTTFTNAKVLRIVKLCVNKFIDYEKKSLINESIQKNKVWTLNTIWGDYIFESDKLVLKPKNGFLKFEYYKNGKRINRGKIKITKYIIDKIALFERKLYLMQNADKGCTFGISYKLNNGIDEINFQDNSSYGFNNEQLLIELKILN